MAYFNYDNVFELDNETKTMGPTWPWHYRFMRGRGPYAIDILEPFFKFTNAKLTWKNMNPNVSRDPPKNVLHEVKMATS